MERYYFFIAVILVLFFGGVVFWFGWKLAKFEEKRIASVLQYQQLLTIERESVALKEFEEKKKNETTAVLFVGDIMLSRGVGRQIKINNDPRYPFLKIADFTRSADLTFGNLEGPISDRGENQGSAFSFRADPRVVEGLVYAGFDVLSLANNHIMDWGKDALADTLDILEKNKIKAVGAGKNKEEADGPKFVDLKNARIALFAYTNLIPKSFEAEDVNPGLSGFNEERIKKQVKRIKREKSADIIVISFHWGEEYKNKAGESQKKLGRGLIDAGADLIVGHHPHVIQEVEQYGSASSSRAGWIAYSLGNFVFDQNFSEETNKGLVLKAIIKDKKIVDAEKIEIKINNFFQPYIP